jgi:hypothetical protein
MVVQSVTRKKTPYNDSLKKEYEVIVFCIRIAIITKMMLILFSYPYFSDN